MLYKNAMLFLADRGFAPGSFRVEDGRFAAVGEPADEDAEAVDLGWAAVLPGLVDIHVHGSAGADFSDGDDEGLRRMSGYLARCGITSFAPASMSLPYDVLARAFAAARRHAQEAPAGCARLLGIHMEGPFLSKEKRGAHEEAYLRSPDIDAFFALQESCGGLIRIVDVAPELPGAAEFARRASEACTVSAAHTAADYDAAAAFFDAGASHLTHLFNAMTGIHHRRPGPIAAASERANVYAELIGDGFHVHKSAVRMAFRLFPDRICLVSDALRGCGTPEADSAGAPARLPDGTIAGGSADLFRCLRQVILSGVDPTDAIRAATIRPARQAGAEELAGSIENGKPADFLVCAPDLTLREVHLADGTVYPAENA